DCYEIGPDRLIVVHDDLDVPYGALRAKLGGGDNGRNGLKSITKSRATRQYLPVRFGPARPPSPIEPAPYGRRHSATAERKDLPFLVDRAADVVESLMERGLEATQNDFHRADLKISGPPR